MAEEKIAVPLQAYTHEEVLKAATEYFKGDTLAAGVWMNKYALKNSEGDVFEKTPEQMHRRIASEIARVEKKYPNPMSEETIFELLDRFKYIIPAGSPMAGIGNNLQVSSLSNCFVIGNDGESDSYGGIMKIDQEQVQLMKRRGGVGHDLSHIRPAGSKVKNSALTSTGIVPFMERYSNSTREVAQDGRRGALMLSISVKHPDTEKFIDAKMEQGKVTGANVSVKIDDDFMQALKENKPYRQQYPIESENPKVAKDVDAKGLWDKIIHNAWSSAEPGILFWDTVIKESVPDSYADMGFKTVSTNPCGEIPLCPYDSCRLQAINLYSYVDQPFTDQAKFNTEKFIKHVHYAQRMMDDVIDLEIEKVDAIIAKIDSDPETKEVKRVEKNLWENIKRKTIEGRRTGLGITAEGDMLAALGMRYGSDEAIKFSTEIHQLLATEAYRNSVNLAKDRGAFPIFNYDREANNPFIKRIGESAPEVLEQMKEHGRRNIAILTIAPTGSVSICTQTTSGIEPVFLVSYKRRKKVNPNDRNVTVSFVDEIGDSWEEYNVFHPKFLKWLTVKGYDTDVVKAYDDAELQKLIDISPYSKATSNDIDWVAKVKMQGAIQKWVDHSISVTVNLPSDATEELVSNVYQTAWEAGCKGMTIYRDGSRSGVLVSNDKKEEDDSTFKETQAPTRPKRLQSDILRFQNDYEKWIAVVGLLDGKPYEVFTGKADDFYLPPWVHNGEVIKYKKEGERARYDFQFSDKQGYKVTIEGLSRSFDKTFWNYAKLISGILRHGMPLYQAVDLISNLTFDTESINTWKNGVVRSLKKYIPDGTSAAKNKCPECDVPDGLVYKEGCLTCKHCGYSKCE
ncbi:adenosylcobalamin-dependent ribonucleoside-diphosphate reductase [Lentimicrobium sp. S6]|uniref:adenosylcobalamin-dependent ribonucleoside-diphosphate reductase n=1 Tax=Lentimicrobium sp. S6 TaxID=2735872 RepID=UPI001557F887|nr:adenosylcobalamin-dependent ribonucleoside-diphosphate reductase [Lentimicrobium sp. S6]NPD46966.1 adenosylcobalamin-dependent ribonucleoside-diphosphate reductase [Lentimicrobium sp. S6]